GGPVMKPTLEHVIPPKRGYGFTVNKGERWRITDLEGKQVVDMALFNATNPREKLSTSNSRTRYVPKPGAEYVPRDKLMEGDTLMSRICRPMMTILKAKPELSLCDDLHYRICRRLVEAPYGMGPRALRHQNSHKE